MVDRGPAECLDASGRTSTPAPPEEDDGCRSQRGCAGVSGRCRHQDAAALASLFAQDGRFLAPNMEPCAGRAPIEAAIREARKLTIVYGRYALVLEPQDGEPLTDVGKYAVVHESQDGGSTKVVLDIFNSNLPAAG